MLKQLGVIHSELICCNKAKFFMCIMLIRSSAKVGATGKAQKLQLHVDVHTRY